MTEPTRPNYTRYDEWVAVQVIPLPVGWRHVYRNDDGTMFTTDCPGMVLEELRWSERWERDTGRVLSRVVHESPYDTRVKFAETDGPDVWGMAPPSSNYVCTIGPNDSVPHDTEPAS